jgi:hypothetical protein
MQIHLLHPSSQESPVWPLYGFESINSTGLLIVIDFHLLKQSRKYGVLGMNIYSFAASTEEGKISTK